MDNNTKTGISPSTLGRERKRYLEMSQLDGVTKKQIQAQMKIDAMRYAKKLNKVITLEDYKLDIETLPKSTNSGKRESDKVERDTLIVETQAVNGVANLAIKSYRKEIKLSDSDKVVAFDKMGEVGDTLANHLKGAFEKVGGMTMIHAPNSLLCVHIAGWEDGSKNFRFQYAPRKLPITKRSGYRDDSFTAPIFEVAPKPVTTRKRKAQPETVAPEQSEAQPEQSEAEQSEAQPEV